MITDLEQDKLDKLSDLIWWIMGYNAKCGDINDEAPFWDSHLDALRWAKDEIREYKK